METITMSVCFPLTETHIWLGMKKRRFGLDLWNGFGGRKLPNETIRQTSLRETREEAGITPVHMRRVAIMRFVFVKTLLTCEVHYYVSTKWHGQPVETEEMRPAKFKLDRMPYDQMWPADKLYLPIILGGGLWFGTCTYGDPVRRKLIRLELSEVKKLQAPLA